MFKIGSSMRGVALAALVAFPGLANAAPIALDTLYGIAFSGVGSPLVSSSSLGTTLPTNPSGIDSPDAPWTFTLSGPGELLVLDLFLSTDQFEIFNFGSSLGVTSTPTSGATCGSDFTCALNDQSYSRGVFALSAGSYSITGTQLVGISGAGALMVSTAAVPVPAAGLLLGTAAIALGAARTRRTRRAA